MIVYSYVTNYQRVTKFCGKRSSIKKIGRQCLFQSMGMVENLGLLFDLFERDVVISLVLWLSAHQLVDGKSHHDPHMFTKCFKGAKLNNSSQLVQDFRILQPSATSSHY